MQGMWTCANKRCKLQKPLAEFSKIIETMKGKARGNSRQCNDCIARREAEEIAQNKASAAQVQKKHRKK